MSKHAVGYESYLHDFKDGSIWLLKEDALRLGAGYLPVHDDKTMTNKLWAPNEQAELNLVTLLGAINDERLTIERPRTHFVERPGTFDGDGFCYVEAVGFLNWLAQYITQTLAKEIPFPKKEFAMAVEIARIKASLHHHPTDETFERLTLALEGQFDKPLEELPEALRQRVVREFFMVRWNKLPPEQRRCHAQTLDNRNNPDTTEQREWWNYFSPLFTRWGEAKTELAKWEATDSKGLPSEEELKESKIKKLQAEIERINEGIKAPPALVPVAGHQSADPQIAKQGGRPPSQLYLGVEALYLEKLAAGQIALLQPQAGAAFMDELRRSVVCEKIADHIRKLERKSGRYRVFVHDPPEIDGKPPKRNLKPGGYTATDVSKIMNRLRKKYPLE